MTTFVRKLAELEDQYRKAWQEYDDGGRSQENLAKIQSIVVDEYELLRFLSKANQLRQETVTTQSQLDRFELPERGWYHLDREKRLTTVDVLFSQGIPKAIIAEQLHISLPQIEYDLYSIQQRKIKDAMAMAELSGKLAAIDEAEETALHLWEFTRKIKHFERAFELVKQRSALLAEFLPEA